jgi:hypothetical protein
MPASGARIKPIAAFAPAGAPTWTIMLAEAPAGVRFLVYTEFKDLKDHKYHVRTDSVDKCLFHC